MINKWKLRNSLDIQHLELWTYNAMPQVHRLFFTVWQKPFKMLWLLLLLIIMRSMLIILSRRLLTAPAHGHDSEKRPRALLCFCPDTHIQVQLQIQTQRPNRTEPYRTELIFVFIMVYIIITRAYTHRTGPEKDWKRATKLCLIFSSPRQKSLNGPGP